MGCDGGTIPKRDELVRTKKRPEQVDKDAETAAKWRHCAISQNELKAPIVACELGRLYNKDAVIEYLLNKSSYQGASHIRNLKDIIALRLTVNPAYKKNQADKGDEYVDRQMSEYICPVTGIEMNGRYKFCFSRLCGCVVSERSLKMVISEACHQCGKAYKEEDLVTINGTEPEVESLRLVLEERRLQAKLNKKAKRDCSKQANELNGGNAKKAKMEVPATTIQKNFTKVNLTGQPEMPSTSTAKDVKGSVTVPSEEKLKSYSVAKDPNASEAYKSLFTTHESCKKQERAHWITYNPLYN